MKHIKMGIKISIFFIIVCGLLYPLVLTGIGQAAFHKKANGSLIYANGKVVGSTLIGQEFTNPKFFEGRPSSIHYDCSKYSSEDNLAANAKTYGPNSQELKDKVNDSINKFLAQNPTVKREDLPASLFTESASGLDPDISLQAAQIQIDRVATNTGISKAQLENFINTSLDGTSHNGTKLVNVLELNLQVAKELKMI
ncbi:MAG: potassium-transporting ATPase subunit C [Sarcina sp.]